MSVATAAYGPTSKVAPRLPTDGPRPDLELTFFETERKADRRWWNVGFGSAVIHIAVIVAAVYGTRQALGGSYTVHADTTIVLLTSPQQRPPEPESVALQVPLKGFQTVDIPTVIPATIPAVNLQEHFDPNDYTGRGAEGGRAEPPLANQLYAEAIVEEKPRVLSAPPPAYPEALRRLGVEGHVVVQAVVDTTGRVEPASVRIIKSSNSAFDQPTRQWVLKVLFRPARLHGEAVRVLINQPVDYSLTGSRAGG